MTYRLQNYKTNTIVSYKITNSILQSTHTIFVFPKLYNVIPKFQYTQHKLLSYGSEGQSFKMKMSG